MLSIGVAPEAATAQDYFEIRVTDAAGAPAPCVTLRTVNGVAQVSDDAGRVAFYEPGLMDTEVFFYVEGEGVLFPADGFGFAGTRLTVSEGGVGAIEVTTAPPCDGGDLATRRLARGVLAPEGYGEIIGGSQRIHDHDLLRSNIESHGLPLEAFQWYLDIRKYGTVPHSGFGMGIERFVTWLCGLKHLRETIPYPRQIHRLYP